MEKQEMETDTENENGWKTENDLYQFILTDTGMHLYLAQSLASYAVPASPLRKGEGKFNARLSALPVCVSCELSCIYTI